MRLRLPVLLLAAGLSLSPALGQSGDSPAPLTPATLGQLAECRGSADDLLSYAGTLFSDKPPSWLKPVHDNGHQGMIGLWTYQLDQSVDIFGHKIDRVSFMKNWVVVEMSRGEALSVVGQRHMERAPIHVTEQYYHFDDAGTGPMLGVFAPTDDVLDMAFGAPPKSDNENSTLFVGCNYSVVSKAEFLDGVRKADRMFGKAGGDIRHTPGDRP